MGTGVSEVTESLQSPHVIKVHQLMCTELITLVNRVSNILPEIEAARPRCSSGIKALCLLNKAIDKAKLLIQSCIESSKLYLALTGDVILSRCKKSKICLEQSLGELQAMVPVLLAAKIYPMISDLRNGAFCLDPSEEEAGKVLQRLLRQYSSATDSIEETAFKAILVAAQRLGITSQKALRIEQRSIKKLLYEVGENDPRKKNILLIFLYLLRKYGELIVKMQKVQEEPFPLSSSYRQSVNMESGLFGGQDDAQMNMSSAAAVPEQFICPLTLRLMYDPVIIASGETFERLWIQKWFDEGHDTCPKTKRTLPHLSVTPNTVLKDLITKWCTANKASISDPSLPVVSHPLETSSCSIASLSSSLNDLSLPLDFSNFSTGSSNSRQDHGSSNPMISNGQKMMSTDSEDLHSGEVNAKANERDMGILLELDILPWKLRGKVIQDFNISENYEHQTCNPTSCRNLLQIIFKFLKDARDLNDVEAEKTGCVFLLSFLKNCSSCIQYLEEETYRLLVSFLDTEAVEETLCVLEVLSRNGFCNDNFTTPGALSSILRILDKEIARLQELALRILCNFSENSKIMSFMVVPDIIPKLIAFLEDGALASYSIAILEKFCYKEDARDFVAETEGCISSIIKLLESASHDDQEHAVAVLLSLCSQRVQYCQLVMDEGVIPFLVNVSYSGNNKTKAMATELRRLLRDEAEDNKECHEFVNLNNCGNHSKGRKSFSKAAGIIRKVSKLF